ncbi:hypothetical protein [Maridesulfovibrio sp.]|uniref:RHS repeat domain-containing protein n=1 Tax=Maridesulfovibrio sp. TaxID=2795000 RepID=UPI002A18C71C|nr:hypothetical protein [Maridesulfovibrio sp.]
MTNCPAHQFGPFSIIQNTVLIHFGYREYDPVTGRFISSDPLGYAGGEDAIKFGSYVSAEKREIFNKMVKEAKEAGADKAFNGFMEYGPVGAGIGLAGGSIGMLKGLVSAIQNNKEPNNEAAQKVEDNFREQRQNMEEHLGNFKKKYRK